MMERQQEITSASSITAAEMEGKVPNQSGLLSIPLKIDSSTFCTCTTPEGEGFSQPQGGNKRSVGDDAHRQCKTGPSLLLLASMNQKVK